jgi:hypothetical protein
MVEVDGDRLPFARELIASFRQDMSNRELEEGKLCRAAVRSKIALF